MQPFGDFIVALANTVPTAGGAAEDDVLLSVASLDVELPLESRIEGGAELEASLPRGRLATGFDPPLGRLTARFEVRGT